MKRILLFLLLFVNLQIVFHNGILDCSFTSVYAQHMTREAGDNCYDSEIGWYHSPFSDCRDVEVTPKKCQYCGTSFDTDLAVLQHEKDCPSKPKAHNCSYCNEGFDDFADFCNHENQCPDRFKCSRCGNKFTSQYDLDNHTCGGQNNQGGGGSIGGGSTGGSSGSGSGQGNGNSGPKTGTVGKAAMIKACSDAFRTINTKYPNGAHCNQGVMLAFKNAFGHEMPNMTANQMLKYMRNNSSWKEVPLSEVNKYANEGYFIVGGIICPCPGYEKSEHGHVNTVLPGYEGTTLKDVHVMDTGVPAIRSEDKPDNTSFNKTSHSSIHFYMYNE